MNAYKKLIILCLLFIPAMVMGVGNEHSMLGKRSAETMLPGQPPLKWRKIDNAVENAGAISQGQSVLLPVEDSRSRLSWREESPGITKSDMSTSSDYVTSLNWWNPNAEQTQLCPTADFVLEDYSNEGSETFVHNEYSPSSDLEILLPKSNSSDVDIYGDDSYQDGLALLEELSRSSVPEDTSQESYSYDDAQIASSSSFTQTETDETEFTDLYDLAEEVFEEEAVSDQNALDLKRLSGRWKNNKQTKPLIRVRYFCPECLVDFITIQKQTVKKIKHDACCSFNQDFKREDVLSIDAPLVISHKSGDIYCLHPKRGAIYLQNSKGLSEDNFDINSDGSFTYDDGVTTKVWDEFGFDEDTRQELAKTLKTKFAIISRMPKGAKKVNIEFICPACSRSYTNEIYLKAVHIKYEHPELIVQDNITKKNLPSSAKLYLSQLNNYRLKPI